MTSKFAIIDLEPITAAGRLVLTRDESRDGDEGDGGTRLTAAQTDSELAREFIGHGELSPASRGNTQKELFRFLTWCREEARKTLRQLTVADLNGYKEFLRAPPPDWVCSTKWPAAMRATGRSPARCPTPAAARP